jgi:adenylate cyclase 5
MNLIISKITCYFLRIGKASEGHRLTTEGTSNGHSTSALGHVADSSDGEQEEVESILLDHSNGSWWNMLTLCKRVFRSHRFRNVQAEVLYQRYFLRMNQNNMASLLGLLIAISVTMIAVNHLPFPAPLSGLKETDKIVNCCIIQKNKTIIKDFNTINNITLSDDSDFDSAWFSTSDGGIVQGATLGVLALMYLLLLVLMTRKSLNEVYLIIFSYIILASFFGIEVGLMI